MIVNKKIKVINILKTNFLVNSMIILFWNKELIFYTLSVSGFNSYLIGLLESILIFSI